MSMKKYLVFSGEKNEHLYNLYVEQLENETSYNLVTSENDEIWVQGHLMVTVVTIVDKGDFDYEIRLEGGKCIGKTVNASQIDEIRLVMNFINSQEEIKEKYKLIEDVKENFIIL